MTTYTFGFGLGPLGVVQEICRHLERAVFGKASLTLGREERLATKERPLSIEKVV